MENSDHLITYTDIMLDRIEKCPETVYTHLVKDDGEIIEITYRKLYDRSLQYAACFAHNGVGKQDRVVIILPTGAEFIYSLYGTYLMAACPVPAYPPFRLYDIPAYVKNLAHILNNCEPKVVVGFSRAAEIIQSAINHSGLKIPLILENELESYTTPPSFSHLRAAPEDLALIQYTSGSTGRQKGVSLNYANLIFNNKIVGIQGNPKNERVVQVSWLPLYHDMGLISSLLTSFYLCHLFILMSPQYFLRDPKTWLWIIHRFRGTLSLAPNFAYSLCVKKIRDEDIKGLDLSSWNNAGCAAEPIDPVTMNEFIRKFRKYGFPETGITPYYGLAELTVAATGFPVLKKYKVDNIDREHIEKAGKAEPSKKKNAVRVVCVGPALPGHKIRIVDEKDKELPPRREGEITLAGPCVMQGYYRAPEATAHVLKDGWLYTGDLGYVTEDGLYITGRKKDMIIKGGRNFYPHLLETVTQGIEGIRKGCTVAFGVNNERTGTEDIVILAETRLNLKEYKEILQSKIREAILGTFQVSPDAIEILPPSSLHKTSSGKLQRIACRESYIKGFFRKKRSRAWLSILKIYGENRIQTFRGFFQEQRWSRIWQRPMRKKSGRYPVVENALVRLPADFSDTQLGDKESTPPCEDFQQLLFYREQRNAGDLYGHILEGKGQQRQMSYHNVYSEAQQYAFGLKKMGIGKGNRVVIIMPKRDFTPLFFACTLLGAVPVPIQPPFYLYELQSYIQYLIYILDDSHPSLVVSFSDVREITQAAILKCKHNIPNINVESLLSSKFRKVTPASVSAGDVAFIHYTPGTTELPKGVMFSHTNLLDNIRSFYRMLDIGKKDVFVSWITLYDTTSVLTSLCAFWGNFPMVLISPEWALQSPKVWLWTIHSCKGTISLAPALLYRQLNELPEEEIRGLNLKSWRIALYGEDASDDTLQKFAARFSPYKFDKNALVSCYIPGEIGLAASITPPGEGMCVDRANYRPFLSGKDRLENIEVVSPCLSMGKPLFGYDIRIVDKAGATLSEGSEGEVMFRCPSPIKGYLNAVKNGCFSGEWLSTGDLGYFREGYLHLTGRKETLIEKEGKIFYPSPMERSIEKIDGIRPGGVVALGLINNGTEEVIILAEVQLGIRKTNYEITHEIQKSLDRHGCCPDEIVLLPPHCLPRSLAGAIQRAMCLEHYTKGNLYKRHKRMWLEMLKIYSGNRLRRIQDSVKIWQWFRSWRERRRMQDNDPEVVQKEMSRIIANEMDIALSQLGPNVDLMKDLGLDSLKAIELLAIMEENFEVSIPNDSLEKYATLSSLAAYICELRSNEGEKQESMALEEPARPAAKDLFDTEMLVLSALNRNSLAAKIKSLQKYLATPAAPLANLCYNLSSLEGKYRLALVVDSRENLSAKLQEALDEISAPGEVDIEDPRGIYFFGQEREKGKVAFLFPGQGVQYPGMLQDLRQCFPVVNKTFRHFDRLWDENGLKPISAYIGGTAGYPPDQLMQIQISQPAILVSDLALHELLLSLQLKPDIVAGHSYGEFVAAYAAGIFASQTLEKIGLGAGRLKWSQDVPDMGMAAVSTSCEKVQDVIKIVPGALFVANKNCAVQTVISGDKTAIEQAVKIFRTVKIMAEALPIPYAFHSPLAEPLCQDLKESLQSVPLQIPEFPIYSCMTGKRFPDSPDKICSLLCEQILQTVMFEEMIHNIYEDGARVFVEVGPRNILSNFIKRILQGRQYCAISADHHLRSGMTQLNHLLALMAARGVQFSLDSLYAHRNVVRDIGILNALTLGA